MVEFDISTRSIVRVIESNMAGDPDYNSSLSKTPKTLFVLWQDWEVGIGGQKPARLFTRVERSRVKFFYCWCKILWETVAMLFHAGYTPANTAIGRIYESYGWLRQNSDIHTHASDKRLLHWWAFTTVCLDNFIEILKFAMSLVFTLLV